MKLLLQKFRINCTDIIVIDDIHVKPRNERYVLENLLGPMRDQGASCSYSYVLSLKKLDDMIEPFRLHERTKESTQVEAMRKTQPWKITDDELDEFEEKVNEHTHDCIVLNWRICRMVLDLKD